MQFGLGSANLEYSIGKADTPWKRKWHVTLSRIHYILQCNYSVTQKDIVLILKSIKVSLAKRYWSKEKDIREKGSIVQLSHTSLKQMGQVEACLENIAIWVNKFDYYALAVSAYACILTDACILGILEKWLVHLGTGACTTTYNS